MNSEAVKRILLSIFLADNLTEKEYDSVYLCMGSTAARLLLIARGVS